MIAETIYLVVAAAEKAAAAAPWYTNPGFLALLGTLFGGAGLKVVEKWLHRDIDDRSARKDFREEVNDLNGRIDKLEDEVTQWRTLYYHEQEQVALLRVMVIQLGGQLPQTTLNQINNPKPSEDS